MGIIIESSVLDILQGYLVKPISASNPNITWGMLIAFVVALWIIGDVVGGKK